MRDKGSRVKIKFGTDGWRAKIAREYTFDNVRMVAQAMADYVDSIKARNQARIIVGYDSRFMSDIFARIVAEVLAANGIKAFLTDNVTPTPAISFSIKKMGLDGGIIITASHNPPEFNGIKFKSALAASADEQTTASIERLIGKNRVRSIDFELGLKKKRIELTDASKGYVAFLRSYVDIRKIRKLKPRVLLDYMHGAGAGYLEKVLAKPNNIEAVRNKVNPFFGGVNPEPIPKNLEFSVNRIKNKRFDLGVALDGDADRIGAIRPDGRYINSGEIVSLILLHLLEDRNLCGGVVKTISGTTLIERICERYDMKLFEVPVGFKYISALMLKENILIGGEESGGIGFCGYIPERDGILSALLLMEMVAYKGKSIISIMDDMQKKYGRFCYDRLDIAYPSKKGKQLAMMLKKNPPKRIASKKVQRMKTYDGIKFILEDSSWLLLRLSGTESLIRIYAESGSRKGVERLLSAGKGLLNKV